MLFRSTDLRDLGLASLDNHDPAASLPAVLSWSLRGLTDVQRTVFALLGIAPGPDIGLPATASLTGLSELDTRAVLGALEEASLLDRQLGGRYAMHDLIRAYAAGIAIHKVAEPVRKMALRRVLDFYTQTACPADRLLDPHAQPLRLDEPEPGVHPQTLPNIPAAMAWFDTEHFNLLAAQRTAADNAWHLTVGRLARFLDTFLYRQGHRHDRLDVWRAALEAGAHLPDPTSRIFAHRMLGRAYADLELHEAGLEHLHLALALAENDPDVRQKAHTHWLLVSAWMRRGENQLALEHANRALEVYRILNEPVWEADALNAVGWLEAQLGEYDTARIHCQAALTLLRHHNAAEGEASALDSLGYIAHHSGHHQQAIEYYQAALALLRAISNISQSANTLDALGRSYFVLGEYRQARVAWQEALDLYRQQSREADAARVQYQLDDLGHSGCE